MCRIGILAKVGALKAPSPFCDFGYFLLNCMYEVSSISEWCCLSSSCRTFCFCFIACLEKVLRLIQVAIYMDDGSRGCHDAGSCVAFQFEFKCASSEWSCSCWTCAEFRFTTKFYVDAPQGVHPGREQKTAARPSGYPSTFTLSPQGDSVKATHTHIFAVCSLQLPPLRISSPASKLAAGDPFFLFLGSQC